MPSPLSCCPASFAVSGIGGGAVGGRARLARVGRGEGGVGKGGGGGGGARVCRPAPASLAGAAGLVAPPRHGVGQEAEDLEHEGGADQGRAAAGVEGRGDL